MQDVTIYTKSWCPFCVRAKRLLDQLEVDFTEIDVEQDAEQLRDMIQRANGQRTVPQIWVGSQHVGGCDELFELHRQDALVPLLNS